MLPPTLMYRVTSDINLRDLEAQNKVNEQIEWISQSNVDAIFIMCTNYISILQEEKLSISISIIKIDEPFFEQVCNIEQPQMLLFTNPATVKRRIEHLNQYVKKQKKSIDVEVVTIHGTFKLIMQGLKEEYNNKLINSLEATIKKRKMISF